MRRVFEILRTVLLRPMMWGLGLLVLSCFAGLVALYHDSLADDDAPDAALKLSRIEPVARRLGTIRTIDELRQARETDSRSVHMDLGSIAFDEYRRQNPRTPGETRHLTEESTAEFAAQFAELPLPADVETIHAGGWGTQPPLLRRIGQQTSLRELEFLYPMNSERLDLTKLTKLDQLETLDLGMCTTTTSFRSLVELPRLETLGLRTHQLITVENLAHVARMPLLRALYVGEVIHSSVAMDALSELNASSSLERVYVPVPWSDTKTLQAIQQEIPDIEVRASSYSQGRLFALVIVAGLMIASCVYCFQIITQFSLPYAQLTPGWRGWHQLVTWSLVVLAIVVLAWALTWFGVLLLPALGVTAFGMTGVYFLSLAEPTRILEARRGFNLRFLTGLAILASAAWGLSVVWRNPALVEWFLLTETPLPWVMLAASVGLACTRMWTVHHYCRNRYESIIPMQVSMTDSHQLVMILDNAHGDGLGTQLRDPFQIRSDLIAWFGFIVLLVAAVIGGFPDLLPPGIKSFAMSICTMGAFGAAIMVAAKWWHRMPYYADMMTRPPGRTEQVRKFFRGLGWELSSALPAVVGGLLLGITNMDTASKYASVPYGAAFLLLLAALFAAGYALIVWLLVIRNVWLVALIGVGVYFFGSFAVIGLTIAGSHPMAIPTPARIAIVAFAILVVSIVAAVFARRYYEQRLEWGRL